MKKYRYILYILIALLLIGIFVLIKVRPVKERQKEIESFWKVEDTTYLNKAYEGDTNLQHFYSLCEEVSQEYLFKIYRRVALLNNDELKKYYETNEKTIKSKVGINNYSDFKNFVKLGHTVYGQGSDKIVSGEMEVRNFKIEDNYFIFKISFNTLKEKKISFWAELIIDAEPGSSSIVLVPIM